MALVKCKECGNEISDSALFCPHCGFADIPEEDEQFEQRELRRSAAVKAVVGTAAALAVVGAGVFACIYFSKEDRLKKTVQKGRAALAELENLAKNRPHIKKLLSKF